jgi:hypothetical protein
MLGGVTLYGFGDGSTNCATFRFQQKIPPELWRIPQFRGNFYLVGKGSLQPLQVTDNIEYDQDSKQYISFLQFYLLYFLSHAIKWITNSIPKGRIANQKMYGSSIIRNKIPPSSNKNHIKIPPKLCSLLTLS